MSRTNLWVTLAALLLALVGWKSERIDVNGGEGWDGAMYVEVAKDPQTWLTTHANHYTIQRILPSVVLHYAMRSVGVDPTPGTRRTRKQVLQAFRAFNAVLLTLSVYVWCLTADLLRIGTRGKWLGFTFLVLNYATLKMRSYYAPLTDYSAWALGALLIYFYLRRSLLGVFACTVAGAFTWPVCLPIGVLLLAFPRVDSREPERRAARPWLVLDLFVAGAFAALVYLALQSAIETLPTTTEIVRPVFALSFWLAVFFVFLGAKPLFRVDHLLQAGWATWREMRRLLGLPVLLCVAALGVRVLQIQLTDPWIYNVGLGHLLVSSIVYPAVFYVAHVTWFGPVVILATFLWPRVCRVVREHGLGVTFVTVSSVVLSLDSESRHLSAAFPMLVPFVVKSIEPIPWERAHYFIVAALSLVVSKVWLTIGRIGDSVPGEMPGQLFFMSIGPWMAPGTYVVNAAAALLLAWLLYDLCLRGFALGPSLPAGETCFAAPGSGAWDAPRAVESLPGQKQRRLERADEEHEERRL